MCICTGFSASWTRLCIAQLHVAGSHRYFLTTFEVKLKACLIDSPGFGWRPIHQGIESISSSIPSPVYFCLGLYFHHKQFELESQTRDQSDHLAPAPALAFFLVYKLTFFV